MTRPRKFWLWLAAGVVLVVALPSLLAAFWPEPKGTATPPPGPHKAGDVWLADLGGKTTMKMVWCPPGKFLMGTPDTKPPPLESEMQHPVVLTRGFWIGKYEVTQGQWLAVIGENRSLYFPQKRIVRWNIWLWKIPVWRTDFLVNRWRLPECQIDWDDCQEFCQRAGSGFRLPTEAQWEYACRAGSTGMYAGTGNLKEMGWFSKNSGMQNHMIGRKNPNAWGLYDMHGNVREWCQDWYGWYRYEDTPVTDPVVMTREESRIAIAVGKNRIIRGGGCRSNDDMCRSSARDGSEPIDRTSDLGFRVVF